MRGLTKVELQDEAVEQDRGEEVPRVHKRGFWVPVTQRDCQEVVVEERRGVAPQQLEGLGVVPLQRVQRPDQRDGQEPRGEEGLDGDGAERELLRVGVFFRDWHLIRTYIIQPGTLWDDG